MMGIRASIKDGAEICLDYQPDVGALSLYG
jgi:hypothetical protein